MTIEERAEKWVQEYGDYLWKESEYTSDDMIAAYLAGSAQTQKDYMANG